MSTKKKTGAKLVASIRKSKTGTVANKTSQRPDAKESAAKSKSNAAKTTSKTVPSRRESAPARDRDQDGANYSSRGRRVWPD